MSLVTVGIIGICMFFILLFLGMPIGVTMILVGFVGMMAIRGVEAGFSNLALVPFRQASLYIMSSLPLFILMGYLAGNTGLSEDGFYAANKWFGHRRGGLAISCIIACALFGAVCGDIIAAGATFTSAALPEMRRYKYKDELSLGCIAAGANLSFLIPPSLGFIIYAILTELSIGQLFTAGIGSGILMAVLFIITIAIICRVDPSQAPAGPRASWKERLASLKLVWAFVVLILIVLGGIYAGVFTPTEAGAAGSFAVIVLGLIRRRVTKKTLIHCARETSKLTGMVFVLIIGAMLFSGFMTVTEIPLALANAIAQMHVPPIFVLGVVLMFYILIGFVMDVIAVMMLVAPIIHPILVSLGFDPILVGVLTVITIIMGQISPPFGILVFSLAGMVPDVAMFRIFRGCLPFLGAMFVGLVIIIAFPQIATWLPQFVK